jgi:2-keto-myo-inositol isomerase
MRKISRRDAFKTAGIASFGFIAAPFGFSHQKPADSKFEFCLNTSTIRGQNLGLIKNLEIASRAGYNCVELWISDIKAYIEGGRSTRSLKQIIVDNKLQIANAIGFATWMVDEDEQRKKGFAQMEAEMNILAELGCKRVAAPAFGVKTDKPLDLFKAGERYRQLLDLGRKTGVMPQLEFWGSSKSFYHIGQALMVLAVANDPDGRLLADVFHLFRGGSGFNGLKLLSGSLIEVFHMNDYLSSSPPEQQTDKDRVYPGAGGAPMDQILNDLRNMGGRKILSLELFNAEYWKQDPLTVARTGIENMKKLVERSESIYIKT